MPKRFTLFVAVAVVASATANRIPIIDENTQNPCDLSPSHWCTDLSVALSCNAVRYCTIEFWKTTVPISQHDSTICQSCIASVDKLHISESDFPAPDHQIEAIGEMLNAGLEASQVCMILGICVAVEDNHIDECDKCMQITSSVHQESQLSLMWNNQYSVCMRLANDEQRAECHSFVQVYAGELMSMFVNGVTPIDMCYTLKMCQNNAREEDEDLFEDETEPVIFTHTGTDQATIHQEIQIIPLTVFDKIPEASKKNKVIRRKVCKLIVKAIVKTINNRPITDAVSRHAIAAACTAAGPLMPLCNIVVSEIAKQIIERIRRHQDPFAVCYRI